VCIGDVFGLFRADVWGSAGFAPGGAIDRLAIVIRKRLNDRQRAVLAWIGAGCPEGVMAGSSYKTTAGGVAGPAAGDDHPTAWRVGRRAHRRRRPLLMALRASGGVSIAAATADTAALAVRGPGTRESALNGPAAGGRGRWRAADQGGEGRVQPAPSDYWLVGSGCGLVGGRVLVVRRGTIAAVFSAAVLASSGRTLV
jgi:hypothetical protein